MTGRSKSEPILFRSRDDLNWIPASSQQPCNVAKAGLKSAYTTNQSGKNLFMLLDADCMFEILQYLRRPDIVNLAAAHGSISPKVREAYYFRFPQCRDPCHLKSFLLSVNMHALQSLVKKATPEKTQLRLVQSRSFLTDRSGIFTDSFFYHNSVRRSDLTLRRIANPLTDGDFTGHIRTYPIIWPSPQVLAATIHRMIEEISEQLFGGRYPPNVWLWLKATAPENRPDVLPRKLPTISMKSAAPPCEADQVREKKFNKACCTLVMQRKGLMTETCIRKPQEEELIQWIDPDDGQAQLVWCDPDDTTINDDPAGRILKGFTIDDSKEDTVNKVLDTVESTVPYLLGAYDEQLDDAFEMIGWD